MSRARIERRRSVSPCPPQTNLLFFRRFHKACVVAREGGEILVGFGEYRSELVRDLCDSKEKRRVG